MAESEHIHDWSPVHIDPNDLYRRRMIVICLADDCTRERFCGMEGRPGARRAGSPANLSKSSERRREQRVRASAPGRG